MAKRKQDPVQEYHSRLDAAFPDCRMQGRLWTVAIHEAGHALLAVYMGCDEIIYDIWSDDKPRFLCWSGACEFDPPKKPRSALWDRYISLAGAVAMCLLSGSPLDQVGLFLNPPYNHDLTDLQGAGDYRKRDVTYVARVLEKNWSEVWSIAKVMVESALAEAEAA